MRDDFNYQIDLVTQMILFINLVYIIPPLSATLFTKEKIRKKP